ncbi:hypothetical protein HY411_00210 [Candidatus Gottesmanbacteria bacterium]|nr:hypothetical protein [Candidatus Gottesmanbacteria bacterium]
MLEISVDGSSIESLPDQPWPLPDGGWNERPLFPGSTLATVAWDAPSAIATFFNGTLGPDARTEMVPLAPNQSVQLTFGQVDPELMALFGSNLPIVNHTVTLTRTDG